MSVAGHWLINLDTGDIPLVDGLIAVEGFQADALHPEQVLVLERAKKYGAAAVFFEASRNERPPVAQAFIFVSNGPSDDPEFGKLHRRLWCWGGVPLVYRKTPGLVQLFRCAHKPDFIGTNGDTVCRPIKILNTLGAISADPWWDDARLRNGTLWDDPAACKLMLKADKAAHKSLIVAVTRLNSELNQKGILPKQLRRKLLILSLLIAYLEERGVFPSDYFSQFLSGATRFFQVLGNGEALIALLEALEKRFNGHVFVLENGDRETLKVSNQLSRFARLVEARQEENGQRTLWELYSFKDLPIELISHIYQTFVEDTDSSVYTPPFLVRLILDEVLSWERLDRLQSENEIILDPACGSGVFLVEAYKRLVLHWRSRNAWKRPRETVLKKLLQRVHGIDLEPGAVEVAAFSLCLALCDSLEPEAIRASVGLFPELAGKTLLHSCFFEAKQRGVIKDAVGVVVGNPPFKSSLTTEGAKQSYARYESQYGSLPDKQLAYLFLHESAGLLAPGGVVSMLQQYNFLYNQQSLDFRRRFIAEWDVREILDFISVRGLFQKGDADTKVIVVVAEAAKPPKNRKILHATFRRSGRVDAEQGFDIDYYDLHWLPRSLVLQNDGIWRSNLLGGQRVLSFVDRLKQFRTLGEYAKEQGWNFGEGFIEGGKGVSRAAAHIIGKPLLPSEALTLEGIDSSAIVREAPRKPIEGPRSEQRFTPPMLLVREQMDIPHAIWSKNYLTYKNKIVGFAAPKTHSPLLIAVEQWLQKEATALRAFVAGISVRLFTQKATTLSAIDILALPYPKSDDLDLSSNEKIVADDIVNYYRDLIRLGEDSKAMREPGFPVLSLFADVFERQINTIYKKKPVRTLVPQAWPGAICQPFVFGKGEVEWEGATELKDRIDKILTHQQSPSLRVTRITRIYDGSFIFLLKPDRLRYWLRSVALRDADETLADLRVQGF